MRKIIVKMNTDKAALLERTNFELGFTKDIIQRIIESHPNDPNIINGETFRLYQKQGAELQAQYNMITAELEKEYLPEALRGHQYSWFIPFDSDEMIISIMCDCEIDGLEGVIVE